MATMAVMELWVSMRARLVSDEVLALVRALHLLRASQRLQSYRAAIPAWAWVAALVDQTLYRKDGSGSGKRELPNS